MRIEELSRLQGYLILQVLSAGFLVFWLIPFLISLATPLSYRQIVSSSHGVLITALATGKVLVVIPMVIEAARELLERQSVGDRNSAETVEAIVPLAYPFPHLGRLLGLTFIPFAAWFVGRPMPAAEYPPFLATGYLSMFGSTVVGIPYLLDAQRLPADMFQLFLASGVICGRLSDAVGAMHLFAMAVVTPAILCGQARFKPAQLFAFAAASALLVVGTIVGTRIYLASTLGDLQQHSEVLARMHSPITTTPAIVHRKVPDPVPVEGAFTSRVERVRATKSLRVGYHPDNLPFSFFNASDELVGFDVDMASLLAEDVGVRLEFVPFDFETLHEQLDRGDFDVAMSGIVLTPTRLLRMSFSESYLDSTLAFVVKDYLRDDFSTRESAEQLTNVRVAVPRSDFFAAQLKVYLPLAEVVRIASPREFFEDENFDAMLITAEAGSAWTIRYPDYAVAIPQPDVFSQPLSYAVPQNDTRFVEFIDRWIELKKGQPIYGRLYDHWIAGKSSAPVQPRWCIIRDVLHWVE